MSLDQKLAGMTEDAADRYISQVWKSLSGTEQFEALSSTLTRLDSSADKILIDPKATADARNFACGFKAGIRAVASTIQFAIDFQPPVPDPNAPIDVPFTVLDGGDAEENAAAIAEDNNVVY